MSTSNEEPRFTRKPTPEWQVLEDFAATHLASQMDPDRPSLQTIRHMIYETDTLYSENTEAAEETRYYMLGRLGRELAVLVYRPDIRQRIVEEVGYGFWAEYWRRPSRQSKQELLVSDLRPGVAYIGMAQKGPFRRLSRMATTKLSPAQLLVANCLVEAQRLKEYQALNPPPYDNMDKRATSIAVSPLAANQLGMQAITGAITVLSGVIERKMPAAFEDNLPLFQTITERDLVTAALRKVGSQTARLRGDELLLRAFTYIHLDASGEPTFGPIPKSPPPLETPVSTEYPLAILHTKRLGCPMLYVHNAIPTIMDILGEGLLNAKERAASGVKQQRLY
jgi:hypothetical protein